jgi:hypothetical protein
MTTSAPHSHHVFVDFENVPSVDLGLIETLPVLVTLLIGKTQSKVDTALLEQVHILATKVRIIRLAASGRNALDLTLAYYVGQAVIEHDGVELHIVSKDKDFDPLISHLREKKVSVTRSESFAALPFLVVTKPTTSRRSAPALKKSAPPPKDTSNDRLEKVIARLRDPLSRNRPSTERALRAHLRTALGKNATEETVEDALGQLRESAITIDERGKVLYRDAAGVGSAN